MIHPVPEMQFDQSRETDGHHHNSKHILNAQVAIRSPCCKLWFDCAQCHAESQSHSLKQAMEMVFACKKCKKCFRKDMNEFEDSDEYCPHCDNRESTIYLPFFFATLWL
jgi:uncharacterized CHY-type Zn-finger protein